MKQHSVSSIKMWFFDCLTKRCRRALNEIKFKPLRRSEHYRSFDKGLKEYYDEVNIVNLLRELRYLKAAIRTLMKDKSLDLQNHIQRRKTKVIAHARTIDLS